MVSPEFGPFDPELEHILREVARDSRSCLLRVKRPLEPLRLADEWQALSRWTPGLTAAEKHLLDAHRCEAAWLLRERWVHEITVRPSGKFTISRLSRLTGAHDAPVRQWDEERNRMRRDFADDGDLASAVNVASAQQALSPREMTDLLVVAERLAPTASGKLLVAQDLVRNEQHREAVRWLRRALQVETRPKHVSLLWDSMALSYGAAGELRTAVQCYARASRLGEPRFNPMGYWLILALQVGDLEGFAQAARRIESHAAEALPFVEEFVAQQRRTRASGAWKPSATSERDLPRARDQVGDTARKVLDVFA